MSVYIKGFPLPNNCGACPLRLAWCRERIYMVTRPERCPLVPVPPHGDLIDADKLVELCDIMADKCDGIGVSIWHQFKTTVEWSPIVIPAEEDE